MGDVIDLAAIRGRHAVGPANPGARPAAVGQVEFYFDLACPFSYLAAERIERTFAAVRWQPATASALHRHSPDVLAAERVRREAELRAATLRMPLQWPERWPAEVPAAMRAAQFAAERGRGAPFVLAAVRLAFCGGFDLADPEILAEAAAAAGIGLEETLAAARDLARDAPIDAAARSLLAAGADRLPVLRAGRVLACGESRISAASLAARARRAAL